MSRIQPVATDDRPLPTGVRKTKWRLSVLAFVVVMGPGLIVYAGLRAVGLGIGAAGLLGLFFMFVGAFLYPMWLFSSGHRGTGHRRQR